MRSKYKVLIFDFDGTLADTGDAIRFCMKAAFKESGLTPPTEEAMNEAIGIPLAGMIARAGNLDKETAEEMAETYRKYYRKEGMEMTKLFPNAFETLKKLKEAGYIIAVLSNKKHDVVETSVEKMGILPFCSFVCGEQGGELAKPNKVVFTKLIEPVLKTPASECLMIGDAVQDTGFALNCGMDAAWASYGFGKAKECINENVKFVLKDISELTDILG